MPSIYHWFAPAVSRHRSMQASAWKGLSHISNSRNLLAFGHGLTFVMTENPHVVLLPRCLCPSLSLQRRGRLRSFFYFLANSCWMENTKQVFSIVPISRTKPLVMLDSRNWVELRKILENLLDVIQILFQNRKCHAESLLC